MTLALRFSDYTVDLESMIEPNLLNADTGRDTSAVVAGKWLVGLPRLPVTTALQNGQLVPVIAAESKIADRYEVLSVIARGGMGIVYKARQLSLGRLVAIKILPAPVDDCVVYQRFELEARSLANLSHQNIVSIYDYGQMEDGRPFLVMEFIEGASVASLLREKRVIAVEQISEIVAQVCDGLSCAHKQKLIHRDLKPGNILVSQAASGTNVKLIDFGLAKRYIENQPLTQSGVLVGTPLYMSPEQCRGEATDARSDIYSLGCVLFEMCCGVPPHKGDSHISTVFKHLNETPDFNRPAMAAVPAELKELIRTCLQKEPHQRFQSALELKSALLALTTTAIGSDCESSVSTIDRPAVGNKRNSGTISRDSIPLQSGEKIQDDDDPLTNTRDTSDKQLSSSARLRWMNTNNTCTIVLLAIALGTICGAAFLSTAFQLSKGLRVNCLPLFESINPHSAFHLAVDLADGCLMEGNADHARRLYEKARQLSDFQADFAPAKVAHVHASLGKLYQHDSNRLHGALYSSRRARTILEEFKQTASPEYAQVIADIAAVQAQQGDISGALESCDQAISEFHKLHHNALNNTELLHCNQLRTQLSARLESQKREQEHISALAHEQRRSSPNLRKGIQQKRKNIMRPPGALSNTASKTEPLIKSVPAPTAARATADSFPPLAPALTPATLYPQQPPQTAKPARPVMRYTHPPARAPKIQHKRKRESKFMRGLKKAWENLRSL